MDLRRICATTAIAAAATLTAAACGPIDEPRAATPTVQIETVTVTAGPATGDSTTSAAPETEASDAETSASENPADESTVTTQARRGGLTTTQANAVAKAESYLEMSGFSRSGLIEQLQFEGFSETDATFAVDRLAPDWTRQAERKAAEYMDMTAFSEQGLIDQLVFEGFTAEQAAAGAASQF